MNRFFFIFCPKIIKFSLFIDEVYDRYSTDLIDHLFNSAFDGVLSKTDLIQLNKPFTKFKKFSHNNYWYLY